METWAISWLRPLFGAGLRLFYPDVCQTCGVNAATPAEGYVCADCWQLTRFIVPPFCSSCGIPSPGAITGAYVCSQCRESKPCFESARSAVVANRFLLHVIHRYNYGRALYFEPFLAGLLIRQALPELKRSSWDWIVPVPLHSVKQREREFNQAERLALCLGRAAGIEVNKRVVKRVLATRSQTTLDRKARAANMRNAFVATGNLKGKKIILLDDVLTTCATTNACAGALLAAGAGRVCVWTVARGV